MARSAAEWAALAGFLRGEWWAASDALGHAEDATRAAQAAERAARRAAPGGWACWQDVRPLAGLAARLVEEEGKARAAYVRTFRRFKAAERRAAEAL